MDAHKAHITYRPYCIGYNVPDKAHNVLCSDGVRRTAQLGIMPDTYFSIPARIRVKGVTVTGAVCLMDEGDYHFVANADGKNAHMLPKWA